jgi:hypothetical protein
MSNEISFKDKIEQFAKQTNRECNYKETPFTERTQKGILPRKTNVTIKSNKVENGYYFAHYNTKTIGENRIYSGFFFPIDVSREVKITLRKKDIFDKLRFSGKKEMIFIGQKDFDNKLYCEGNDERVFSNVFGTKEVQNLALETLKLKSPLKIGLNNFEIDEIDAFKEKSIFGIYSNDWIEDIDLLENLFLKMEAFYNALNKSNSY